MNHTPIRFTIKKDAYLAQADIFLEGALMAKGLQIDFAAHIVRALNAYNAHDELLAAAKDALALLSDVQRRGKERGTEKLEAAIGKAEGSSR
jgi:hypothetical protein